MDLFTALRTGIEDEIAFQGPIVPSYTFSDRIRALIPANSPVRSLHTLDAIADFVKATVLTPVDAKRTHAVPGTGNPDADLIFIGEAPGKYEDLQGLPFVGRAGKLLTNILKAIDLDRSQVYITNILKTRPPNNRNPNPDEIAAHIPVLYQQLALIRPKVLCCLGKIAGNTLLNCSQSLASMRGRPHLYHGIPLYVTYHPAALLRNPRLKRPTWEDVQKLRDKYAELSKTR